MKFSILITKLKNLVSFDKAFLIFFFFSYIVHAYFTRIIVNDF